MKIHQRVLRWLKGVQFVHPATLVLLVLAISLIRGIPEDENHLKTVRATTALPPPPSWNRRRYMEENWFPYSKRITKRIIRGGKSLPPRTIPAFRVIYFFFFIKFREIYSTHEMVNSFFNTSPTGGARDAINSFTGINSCRYIYMYIHVNRGWKRSYITLLRTVWSKYFINFENGFFLPYSRSKREI